MDATELGRWTRFATKGGIGKCTALQDNVAEEPEDLMFMKDDEITVLMQLGEQDDMYLGYCEGVVGRFRGAHVRFNGRLKKPVMAKRTSSGHSFSPSLRSRSQSRPSSSQSAVTLAARDAISPPIPYQSSPSPSRASSPRICQSASTSSSLATELTGSSSSSAGMVAAAERLAHSGSMSSMRGTSPLRHMRSLPEAAAIRSMSISSSRSATLETAPPATPGRHSPDEEEHTVRIAVNSRDHPSQLSPVVRESVLFPDDDEDAPLNVGLTPGLGTSPLNIRKSPLPMRGHKEALNSPSPNATRAGGSPDASPRSFSFSTDDPSGRLSVDMSAGVEGIGLSLLQGFISGGGVNGDDDASIVSSRSGANTPRRDSDADLNEHRQSIASTVNADDRSDAPSAPSLRPSHVSSSVYTQSRSPSPTSPVPPSLSEFRPPNPPYVRDSRSGSQRSSMQSLKSMRSLQSMRPSLAGSEHSGGSEWEGDIYDDYRYSRFSMASKMSRFSQMSIKPPADIPPVPADHPSSKLSMESHMRLSEDLDAASRPRDPDAPPPAAVLLSSEGGTVTNRIPTGAGEDHRGGTKERDRPSPLPLGDGSSNMTRSGNVNTAHGTSPLLHASFGSPTQSITPKSPKSPMSPNTPISMESFVSPPPTANYLGSSRDADSRQHSGHDIVVDDDEQPAFVESPVSSQDQLSFMSEKFREVARRSPSPSDEPAPPPYAMAGPSSRPIPSVMSPPPEHGPPFLRTRSVNQSPADPAARTSLFMPHPHAPKPAQVPAGPMYGRHPAPAPQIPHYNGPPPGSAVQLMHTLLSQQMQGRRPGGMSTIYACFDRDLASSIGPVPISFSLEPQMNVPANRPTGFDMYTQGPSSRTASPSVPPRVGTPLDSSPYDVAASMASTAGLARSATASPVAGTGFGRAGAASPAVGSSLARSATASPRSAVDSPQGQGEIGRLESVSSGKTIPRQNFFPKAGTQRPRSRSFSGFDSPFEVVVPAGEHEKDGHSSAQLSSVALITKRSKSATATPVAATSSVSVPLPQRATLSHTASVVRGAQKPSPLSLSQNNMVAALAPPTHNGPFAGRPMLIPATSSTPGSPLSQTAFDRNGTASPAQQRDIPTGASPSSPPSSPRSPPSTGSSFPVIRHSRSSLLPGAKIAIGDRIPMPRPPAVPVRSSLEAGASDVHTDIQPSNSPDTCVSLETRLSVETTGPSRESSDSRPPSQFHIAMKVSSPSSELSDSGSSMRVPSLRSRVSSSVLRPSQHSEPSPVSSVFSFEQPADKKLHVSVKDMDFELVTPRSPLAASSADSLPIPSSASEDPEGAACVRRPSLGHPDSDKLTKATDAAEVEAHRQREQRWISALSSTPPAQARKKKQIRRLVLEGVPASVRYMVWAHLIDSKGKRMDGLYTQLGQRERVGPIANIERDAQRIFYDQPLLDQSLVNLLQAYLSMVPDVQYTRGLAMIAGQLLLQSPEEDAFWTFVTLMDSHIRPYFSPQPIHLEIDASLFSKALESNDNALARRIFVDMAVPPICICRPWFTSLYVDAFPSDFLLRIWDVFLYEGVAFLFRIGLSIISCCRQLILRSAGQEHLLSILARPPSECLPSTPDAFIELALAVRLKDDEIYKQRNKLEAQLKRQLQTRPQLSGATRGPVPTISLPRS